MFHGDGTVHIDGREEEKRIHKNAIAIRPPKLK